MPPDRPNVLWVCTDQHRYDAVGWGDAPVDTPALAGLADAGVRFDRAYCQSPVCAPSRASMLTGRYPRTTGCRQNGQPTPREETLVTARFADAGYHCGLAGKLHLSPTNPDDDASPLVAEPVRRLSDGYDAFHWAPSPEDDHPANEYRQWLRERGATYDPTPYEGSEYVATSTDPEHHHTTWCTDRAIDYVEQAGDRDRPWLLSVNYYDPHHPFDPPRAYLERYVERLDALDLPAYEAGELDGKPGVQREAAHGGRLPGATMGPAEHRLVRAAYYAMVDLVDDQVGRLLDALARTGQREETLVVFCSDHGEMLGDHGVYKKGPYFYEPAVRVPLVVAWPGRVRAGVESDALVELTDLAPTLLDAAGLSRPPGVQGRSLWPLLTGETDDADEAGRDAVYCEFYNASPRHADPPAYATMVRTDRYKLVRHHAARDGPPGERDGDSAGDGEGDAPPVPADPAESRGRGGPAGELYDLARDPDERTNRWTDDDYAGVRAALLARLADAMATTVDPLPERAGRW